MQEFEQIQL